VNPPELCDDQNLTSGDGCDSNCTPTGCGNGVQTAPEQCDDGNLANGDGCDANCTPTACGNGVTTAPETCDDGNLANGDGCDANCTATACGNGLQTGAEQCDDGNLTNDDGCEANCTLPVCGNGIVDTLLGEQCDDGNVADGDCCSGTCDFNAVGTFCDDGLGDLCTATDTCDGAGACVGGGPVTCARCETCDPMNGCVPAIRPSCKTQVTPGAGRLTVRDTLDSRKHKLQWQWAAGAATTVDEFGSPHTTDDLAICLFDSGSQLVASAPVPAGGLCSGKPCWTPKTHGFNFRSRDGVPGGIVSAQLKEGVAGKAKIKIDGKGANLATPATASLSLPLRVQLQSENGECWEATYSASGVLRQDGEWFKGRSD
jgi:cysteine-rich repeat protein